MFSVPSFFTGWGVPSLGIYGSISNALQRRVISFLLRRALGNLVRQGQLDWSQIEAGIVDGRLEIRDVELEPKSLNAFLGEAPVHVTSASLGSITLQIPWSSLWSGEVVITICGPTLLLKSGQAQGDVAPPLRETPDVSASLAQAADDWMQADEEGRELESSLAESCNKEAESSLPGASSSDSLSDAPQSFVSNLVEGLLSRLRVEIKESSIELSHYVLEPARQIVGISLQIEKLSLRSEVCEEYETISKTRSVDIEGLSVWSITESRAAESRRSSGSSLNSRTSTEGSEEYEPADIMRMSQAVDDLAASTVSTISQYTDATAGAASIYASSVSTDRQAREPEPRHSSKADSLTRSKVLSSGHTPARLVLTMKKSSSLGELAGDPDVNSSNEATGAFPLSKVSAAINLGPIACFLEPVELCSIHSLLSAVLGTASSGATQPSKAPPASQGPRLDLHLAVAAVHILCAYQGREELRPTASRQHEEALHNFWSRPAKVQPVIGHVRLDVDKIDLKVDNLDSLFRIESSVHNLALYECRVAENQALAFPVLVFDEHLQPFSGPHRPEAARSVLSDWCSATPESSNAPYQRTGFGEKSWRVRPGVRRPSSSMSKGEDTKTPPKAACSVKASVSQACSDWNAQLAPIHIFVDPTLANRTAAFMELLSGLSTSRGASVSSNHQDLGASVDTINGGPSKSAPDVSLTQPKWNVSCGLIRTELRMSVAAPSGAPGSLRSGLVALDILDTQILSHDLSDQRTQSHRVHFANESAGEVSMQAVVLVFQPTGSSTFDQVLALRHFQPADEYETPLRPHIRFAGAASADTIDQRRMTEVSLPLVEARLTKSSLDGLQLLADDASRWTAQVSALRAKLDDEADALKLLGSRFFSSRAGLSALSSSGSDSVITVQEAVKRVSRLLKMNITEIDASLCIPRTKAQTLGSERRLHAIGRDLTLSFDPSSNKNTSKLQLELSTLSVSSVEGTNSRYLLETTLPQSLTRVASPVIAVQMHLFNDPENSYRESKIEPTLQGFTVSVNEDLSLWQDLAHFAKSPAGVFEDVEPNEVTRFSLKLMSATLSLTPSTVSQRAALLLGDVSVRGRVVAHAPQNHCTITVNDAVLFLVDAARSSTSDARHRIKTAYEHWARQGYAPFVDLQLLEAVIGTRRLTLPELDVKVNSVRAHLSACADTMEVLGALASAMTPIQEAEPSQSDADANFQIRDQLATSAETVYDVMAGIEEDAFSAATTENSVPDLLDDDIPTKPEYFGQTTRAADIDEYQEMPMAEEEFFGSESVASMIEPSGTADRVASSDDIIFQSPDVTIRRLDDRGLRPTYGYFNDPNLKPQTRSITDRFASAFRLRITNCDVTFQLHAGYDWASTRTEIEDACKKTRRRLLKIKQLLDAGQQPDDSVENAMEDLMQSMYLPVDPDADAAAALNAIDDELDVQSETASSASTWQPLPRTAGSSTGQTQPHRRKKSKLERSTASQIDFVIKGLELDFDKLVPDLPMVSTSEVRVRSVQILDQLKTSTWHTFLTELVDRSPRAHRQAVPRMLWMQLLMIQPSDASLQPEARVRAKVSPLRLHVDQDALDFLKKFFMFKKPSQIARDEAEAKSRDPRVAAGGGGGAASGGTFVQYAEIQAIKLKLDYKPKRVDYDLLWRKGKTAELMNFFHFDAAEMTLRQITLRGITGWPRLFDTLNDIWTPDVKANQLADVLSGIAPVRSVVNVGAGVADLVLLPIEQYQKDGRLGKGLKKGAGRFAKATALEMLNLGARVATGTQALLERAEVAMGGPGPSSSPRVPPRPNVARRTSAQSSPRTSTVSSVSSKMAVSRTHDDDDSDLDDSLPSSIPLIDHSEHEALISKYADAPADVREALTQAYASLTRGVTSAARTILAVPMEIYDGGHAGVGVLGSQAQEGISGDPPSSSGRGGSRGTVVKAVPIAVLQGSRGASEALGKTLLGLRGMMNVEDERQGKYKTGKSGGGSGGEPSSSRKR